MPSRPRKREYRHLPDFLYYDSSKKQYRLTLVNGVRKNIGADKSIAIAREYKNIMRPERAVSVKSLITDSGGINGESLPLAEHFDRLFKRIIRDEQPSKSTLSDWIKDAERVKAFFKDIPSAEITLEHVNGFIAEYHADASANVQNRKVGFLKKIFSYAMDESLMLDNPAERKKMKRVDSKRSRGFSKVRGKVGVGAHLEPDERPTFHEIRALAAFMFKQRGFDPQARMAHSDAESTKIYTENHVDWVEVPHCEITG